MLTMFTWLFRKCVVVLFVLLFSVQGYGMDMSKRMQYEYYLQYGYYLQRCIWNSSMKYRISSKIIEAIIQVESGFNYRAVNRNRDGSFDVGLMQINSSWLPRLRQYNIDLKDLFNPCTNIDVGAWILAQCIFRYGYTWDAIGCYNAVNVIKRRKYAWKVYQAMVKYR